MRGVMMNKAIILRVTGKKYGTKSYLPNCSFTTNSSFYKLDVVSIF